MMLSTVLTTTVLHHATVVAGENSLDREVSWVQMVDHPDVVRWVKRGQLLLTTGFNWPKDEEASRQLIRDLNSSGLAGVVLAVPQFHERFPSEAVDEAQRVGLPALELPWDVPFSEVTHDVLAEIISFRNQLLQKSEAVHRALMEAAVSAGSLVDITGEVSRQLNAEVFVTNLEGEILGETSEQMPVGQPEIFQSALNALGGQAWIRRLERPLTVEADPASKLQFLVAPVHLSGRRVALIWLRATGDIINGVAMRAIEHAAMIVALYLVHQRQLADYEERSGNALVAGLLDGQCPPTPAAIERARVSGWSDRRNYRVCLVLLDEPIPLTSEGYERREQWTLSIRRQLTALQVAPLLSFSLNQIHFLLPDTVDPARIWTAFRDTRAAMAISRMHSGVAGMAEGAREVARLASVLKPGRLHHYEEMLFPRALMGDADARDLLIAQLIGPLVRRGRGGTLVDTLVVLANGGFQLSTAAKTLGVHISTIRYRIERIEQILHLSLDDPQTRFRMQVVVNLYRLRDEQ